PARRRRSPRSIARRRAPIHYDRRARPLGVLNLRTCTSAPVASGCTAVMRELGRPVLAAAAVVVCGAVMTILDSTIVNVAIERLGRVFDARLSTIQWVSSAYLLAIAMVIPLAGWAVDRFGTRRVFMTAVAAFAAGSL